MIVASIDALILADTIDDSTYLLTWLMRLNERNVKTI